LIKNSHFVKGSIPRSGFLTDKIAIFGMNLQKVYRNTFAASPIILQSYPVLQGLLMTTN